MLTFFRRFFQSKIGLPIFLGFLVLMALAFAAADITGSTFGGVSGGDRVAVVDGEPIGTSELVTAANTALDQVRQQNPTLTMPEFIEAGALDEVLRQLIDRYAVGHYAEKYGLRAGENLVNSEILQIQAFRSLSGEFDQQIYLAALRQRGLTDAVFRRDLVNGLLEDQLLRPALLSPQMPEKIARQYASLVLERRRGQIALIPSSVFAPESGPTDAQLTEWYGTNRTLFVQPERRTLRFAVFGDDTLEVSATPTEAEIAARYKRDADQYKATERRAVTAFVVPTADAAKALAARIRGGVSLEAAAREAGFSASQTELRDREATANATSFAFAENAFKAAEGSVVEPAQGTLGWYVARVDKIERTPARSLDQVRSEIAEQLAVEKRSAAIADLTAEIEGEIDSGTALSEVAKAYNLKVETTPPLLADGSAFQRPDVQIVPQLRTLLATAFQMEESEPQLAPVPGNQYVIFEVARVEEAAAPPLAQVKEQAEAAWRRAQGAKLARETADRVMKQVRGKTDLATALAALNKPGFEREVIDLERRELLARSQGNVPPPLVLLFSMAEGSVKLLEAPRNIGWYVISLDEISTSPVDEEPGLLEQTRRQLAPTLTEEYRRQAAAAMRKELGSTRNDAAIEAVRKQLAGEQ
ncbi:SurA N-terminal domain-containing protein [Erythrobacter sp. sf7]|uniref:Parvulin-like PPIase n=1 Tax=Erythrobacter fulvus TaxID=2987523 RepID=A0ABT5JMK5_9SPHN|nr:peptidylprolyl isomerase [Erythrobacter fulvus]MDC8753373.1 SurA N-terminal domain-containing protein [Erythrobacter fulvus]